MKRIDLKGKGTSPRVLRLDQAATESEIKAGPWSDHALFVDLSCKKPHVASELRIVVEPHAALTLVVRFRGPGEATIRETVQVKAGAKFRLLNITEGPGSQELKAAVTGKGSVCAIDWIVCARGEDRIALSVKQEFLAAGGSGDIMIRGVVEDRAHVACNGSVTVGPQGAGTATHLKEQFLLLDPGAEADAVPALHVETDDVEAGHAASVTRVDPEDLFVFASRGIPEKEARTILIDGFLAELSDRLPEKIKRLALGGAAKGTPAIRRGARRTH